MLIQIILCGLVLAPWTDGQPTTQPPVYKAISVQNIDTDSFGPPNEFVDVALAVLPQIKGIVQNITGGEVSPSFLKEANRFKETIELFIPFMRKTIEFQARDQFRSVRPEELEAIKTAELALYYIADAIAAEFATNETAEEEGVIIPDYTDLLLDYSDPALDIPEIPDLVDLEVPAVVIPERALPDVKIPRIDIPGISSIPERTVPLQSIPEVRIPKINLFGAADIPRRHTPQRISFPETDAPGVTNTQQGTDHFSVRTPEVRKVRVHKTPVTKPADFSVTRKQTTLESKTKQSDTQIPNTHESPVRPTFSQERPRRVSPSSLLRQRMGTQFGGDAAATDSSLINYSLPGGGFAYKVFK